MLSSKVKFILFIVLVSIGLACTTSTQAVKETVQTQNKGNIPMFYMFQGNDKSIISKEMDNAQGLFSANNEAEWLVGRWTYNWQLNGSSCKDQILFLSNGGYRASSYCSGNPMAMQYTGNWKYVSQGTIQVGYTDWSPKYDQNGEPFTVNLSETFYFQPIDQNRMYIHGETVAYRQ